MDTLSQELLVPLIFVAALLLLERFRPELSAVHREASRYVVAGISILALTSLLKLYFNLGYLGSLPFLSEPLFLRMLVWVGIILGTVCVTSGMSQWLQERRSRRLLADDRIRRLDTIRRLVQITNVETRPERMLELALNCLVDGFGFSGGAVYRHSSQRSLLVMTAVRRGDSTSGFPDLVPYRSGQIDDHAAFAHDCAVWVGSLPRILPVRVGTRLAALFVLWKDESPVPESVGQDLRIGIDILAGSLEHRLESVRNRFLRRRDLWQRELRISVHNQPGLRKSFTRLVRLIRPMITCDAIVVTLVNHATGQLRRFSWGIDEQPLVERGTSASAWRTVSEILRTGEPSFGPSTGEGNVTPYALLDMQSELHFPIVHRRESGAVISFLSSRPNAFGPIAAHLAAVTAQAFLACLRDQSRRRLHLRVRAQHAQLNLLRRRPRPPLTRTDLVRGSFHPAAGRPAAPAVDSITGRVGAEHITGVMP